MEPSPASSSSSDADRWGFRRTRSEWYDEVNLRERGREPPCPAASHTSPAPGAASQCSATCPSSLGQRRSARAATPSESPTTATTAAAAPPRRTALNLSRERRHATLPHCNSYLKSSRANEKPPISRRLFSVGREAELRDALPTAQQIRGQVGLTRHVPLGALGRQAALRDEALARRVAALARPALHNALVGRLFRDEPVMRRTAPVGAWIRSSIYTVLPSGPTLGPDGTRDWPLAAPVPWRGERPVASTIGPQGGPARENCIDG